MKKNFWAPVFILMAASFGTLQADQLRTSATTANSDADHHHHHVYGAFYTKEHALVPAGYAIPFDKVSAVSKHGIKHSDSSGEFLISEDGVYRITYSVSLKEECGQVALELDGNVIPGSEMSDGEDNQMSTLTVLVNICGKHCCEHKLRVINNHELDHNWFYHNIVLHAHNHSVTAAIDIERIADCDPSCCCK